MCILFALSCVTLSDCVWTRGTCVCVCVRVRSGHQRSSDVSASALPPRWPCHGDCQPSVSIPAMQLPHRRRHTTIWHSSSARATALSASRARPTGWVTSSVFPESPLQPPHHHPHPHHAGSPPTCTTSSAVAEALSTLEIIYVLLDLTVDLNGN